MFKCLKGHPSHWTNTTNWGCTSELFQRSAVVSPEASGSGLHSIGHGEESTASFESAVSEHGHSASTSLSRGFVWLYSTTKLNLCNAISRFINLLVYLLKSSIMELRSRWLCKQPQTIALPSGPWIFHGIYPNLTFPLFGICPSCVPTFHIISTPTELANPPIPSSAP